MKPVIDKANVAAIASVAIFYAQCPDGMGGNHNVDEPDARAPEETASSAVGIDGREGRGDAFAFGFTLGLHLGARVGADPLHVPAIQDLITECKRGIAECGWRSDAA